LRSAPPRERGGAACSGDLVIAAIMRFNARAAARRRLMSICGPIQFRLQLAALGLLRLFAANGVLLMLLILSEFHVLLRVPGPLLRVMLRVKTQKSPMFTGVVTLLRVQTPGEATPPSKRPFPMTNDKSASRRIPCPPHRLGKGGCSSVQSVLRLRSLCSFAANPARVDGIRERKVDGAGFQH
jgi:hypothetical protein